jgi:hypothetical protein
MNCRVFGSLAKTALSRGMTLERLGEKRSFRVHRLIGREAERRNLNAALDRTLRFEAPQFVTILGGARGSASHACSRSGSRKSASAGIFVASS